MIRRASTVVITFLLAVLTTAAPAYAGGSDSGGQVHILGDIYCC